MGSSPVPPTLTYIGGDKNALDNVVEFLTVPSSAGARSMLVLGTRLTGRSTLLATALAAAPCVVRKWTVDMPIESLRPSHGSIAAFFGGPPPRQVGVTDRQTTAIVIDDVDVAIGNSRGLQQYLIHAIQEAPAHTVYLMSANAASEGKSFRQLLTKVHKIVSIVSPCRRIIIDELAHQMCQGKLECRGNSALLSIIEDIVDACGGKLHIIVGHLPLMQSQIEKLQQLSCATDGPKCTMNTLGSRDEHEHEHEHESDKGREEHQQPNRVPNLNSKVQVNKPKPKRQQKSSGGGKTRGRNEESSSVKVAVGTTSMKGVEGFDHCVTRLYFDDVNDNDDEESASNPSLSLGGDSETFLRLAYDTQVVVEFMRVKANDEYCGVFGDVIRCVADELSWRVSRLRC
jgi:hypothetical protein